MIKEFHKLHGLPVDENSKFPSVKIDGTWVNNSEIVERFKAAFVWLANQAESS